MPIAVQVKIHPAQFAAWVASKGGTMPGRQRRRGLPALAAAGLSRGSAAPQPARPQWPTQPATNQAATAQN